LPWPAPILRRTATSVEAITEDISAIWQDMIDTMEAMPGVGLAAPQIGVSLRLAVVDASRERGHVLRMANPELLQASPETKLGNEASPNLPGAAAKIRRAKTITVRFINRHGQVDRRELSGLWARSTLHQIDHLNGKMYFDNLSRVKREMLLKKAAKGAR